MLPDGEYDVVLDASLRDAAVRGATLLRYRLDPPSLDRGRSALLRDDPGDANVQLQFLTDKGSFGTIEGERVAQSAATLALSFAPAPASAAAGGVCTLRRLDSVVALRARVEHHEYGLGVARGASARAGAPSRDGEESAGESAGESAESGEEDEGERPREDGPASSSSDSEVDDDEEEEAEEEEEEEEEEDEDDDQPEPPSKRPRPAQAKPRQANIQWDEEI